MSSAVVTSFLQVPEGLCNVKVWPVQISESTNKLFGIVVADCDGRLAKLQVSSLVMQGLIEACRQSNFNIPVVISQVMRQTPAYQIKSFEAFGTGNMQLACTTFSDVSVDGCDADQFEQHPDVPRHPFDLWSGKPVAAMKEKTKRDYIYGYVAFKVVDATEHETKESTNHRHHYTVVDMSSGTPMLSKMTLFKPRQALFKANSIMAVSSLERIHEGSVNSSIESGLKYIGTTYTVVLSQPYGESMEGLWRKVDDVDVRRLTSSAVATSSTPVGDVRAAAPPPVAGTRPLTSLFKRPRDDATH